MSIRPARMSEVLLVKVRGGQGGEWLQATGIDVVADDYLVVEPCADSGARARVGHCLDAIATSTDWLLVTSKAATGALTGLAGEPAVRKALATGRDRGVRVAAVGSATAEGLARLGAFDVVVPRTQTADGLLDELRGCHAGTAVLPRGDQALTTLADGLRSAGWTVDEQVVYETRQVLVRPASADRAAAGDFAVVVIRSPSAARALVGFAGRIPAATTVVCGGPTTAAEAHRLGMGRIVVSPAPTAQALARTVAMSLTAPASARSRSDDD